MRIWSAACSTGDEAFTTACCIAACLHNFREWKIRILGTDIGIGAVEQATTAVFGERAMRLAPEEYGRRFFIKAKDAQIWQAKPVLTEMVTFRQHNLMDPLRERPFDLVFLKNVLIYFDKDSKERVVDNVRSVKARLKHLAMSVSLPTIITGKSHSVEFPKRVTPICIPFDCAWGYVAVEVGLIEEPAEVEQAANQG